jgi:hypothetical protein
MKFLRVLSRLGLLSLTAAVFVGLTGMYGGSVRPSAPSLIWQATREHRPSAPHVGQFPEFLGGVSQLALYALAGRVIFRLRLSSMSRGEERPILLGLRREYRSVKTGAPDVA